MEEKTQIFADLTLVDKFTTDFVGVDPFDNDFFGEFGLFLVSNSKI